MGVGGAQQPVGHIGRHIEEGSVFNRHIFRMASRFPRARSYLGPPALYELRDLGDVQSAQVEVMRQNVLSQLHQKAAVDPLPLEHSHRCLREADESQAG